ncbi:hypothetical protein VNO77_41771 [Canavalia gladiata]|uniref:Uncharacterized protein n=1 Tax=Canavalia gladiata TaxID=3824 RepID=A0AAN9K166_CANGL
MELRPLRPSDSNTLALANWHMGYHALSLRPFPFIIHFGLDSMPLFVYFLVSGCEFLLASCRVVVEINKVLIYDMKRDVAMLLVSKTQPKAWSRGIASNP